MGDTPLHWGFHLWAVTRLINEGCNDGGGVCAVCMDGCSLPVWCCEQDQAPQPPSAPGPGWHGGAAGAVPICPLSQLAHPHRGTSTMGQVGTAEQWGRGRWDRDILGRGCCTLGGSDATLASGKGSPPVPLHPSSLGWRLYAAYRWETEAWVGGCITAPMSPPCPRPHASRGSSCRRVLPLSASPTLTHTLMVTAS